MDFTRLISAVDYDDLNRVISCLDAGDEIDKPSYDESEEVANSCTALFLAAQRSEANICEELLKRRATVDLPSLANQTPLWIASFLGHSKIVALLLQHGANT
ncbi:ankyrin repeat domain-containing protein [Legionella rowbothamii]|uniref:ankyrin repeat domain-containing protein n=1 Tax=Legionella rowbothamii TaxID=96229 RepID=UPI0010556899|nr:ankyrin repeat domain-containing protein [Legionella rowbothamii]